MALREKKGISSRIVITIPIGTELRIYETPDSKWYATEYREYHVLVVPKRIESVTI